MRVGEVLNLRAADADDQKLTIRNPETCQSLNYPKVTGKVSDVEAVRWIENLYG